MNDELITRLYQEAYNEILLPFLIVKNGSPILQYETTDGIEGKVRSKFAELIVQECLSNMENSDGDLDYAIWKTKNDFGIE